MNEFPLMLYKVGDELEWEGLKLATRIVDSAEHEAEALADGFKRLDALLSDKADKVTKKVAAK